jgi:hypothetical protein
MIVKKITRGINKNFADAFKQGELNKLYEGHKDELFIGVRNNYLNLYYNCDSIAKVEYKQGKVICEIDKYYLDGNHYKGNNKTKKIDTSEIHKNYNTIKANSNSKATDEKKAQSRLVILNNNNNLSRWYCFDDEWVKAFETKQQKDEAKFNGRFDIMAISKKKPHKVALIELKYGNGAIGGESGIFKHIEDFKKYKDKNYFNKQEVYDIIESKRMLEIDIPDELKNLQIKDIEGYKFYVITLNNNSEKENGSTPKQTMSGYLFNDKRWNCRRLSTKTVQANFGDVTDKSNSLHVNFLFSTQTLTSLTINDIVEHGDYERE